MSLCLEPFDSPPLIIEPNCLPYELTALKCPSGLRKLVSFGRLSDSKVKQLIYFDSLSDEKVLDERVERIALPESQNYSAKDFQYIVDMTSNDTEEKSKFLQFALIAPDYLLVCDLVENGWTHIIKVKEEIKLNLIDENENKELDIVLAKFNSGNFYLVFKTKIFALRLKDKSEFEINIESEVEKADILENFVAIATKTNKVELLKLTNDVNTDIEIFEQKTMTKLPSDSIPSFLKLANIKNVGIMCLIAHFTKSGNPKSLKFQTNLECYVKSSGHSFPTCTFSGLMITSSDFLSLPPNNMRPLPINMLALGFHDGSCQFIDIQSPIIAHTILKVPPRKSNSAIVNIKVRSIDEISVLEVATASMNTQIQFTRYIFLQESNFWRFHNLFILLLIAIIVLAAYFELNKN